MTDKITKGAVSVHPDIKQVLNGYKSAIDIEMVSFFETIHKNFIKAELSPIGLEAIALLKQFSLRPAKRVRGALTCLAYDYATSEKIGKAGMQAAVAVELIQNYLLIIDDVMDLSELRRGYPTIHKIYNSGLRFSDHTSKMLAIGIGLTTQHLANSALLNIDCDQKYLINAQKLLHRNISMTCFGQLDDIAQSSNHHPTESEIERMYRYKSGYYTFINPMQIGLALAGVKNNKIFKEVETFGQYAGIAFQLTDDLIGLYGDTSKTGKLNKDDVAEGKYTMFVDYAVNHANTQDKKYINSVLGKKDVTDQEIRKFQKIIIATGSYKYVESKIIGFSKKAKNVINASKYWDSRGKELLLGLLDYATERDR